MVLESLRKIFQSKNPQPIIPAKNSQPLKILKNTLKNPFESNEIILKIFSFLDARELGLVSLVCTNWKKLAADNFLWEPIFKKTFPHSSVSIKTSSEILWKQAYIQAKLSPVKSRSYSIPCNEVSFINGNRFIAFEKGVAVRVYELKSGSLIGEAKNNFLGVALEGDILATYSADKSISIWNIISKKCLFSTNSFLNGQRITYLHLHGNLLFCCSNEREPVEVWDYIKGEKLSSIDTCNKFVSQIETRENLVLLRLEGFQRHQRDSLFLIYDTSLRKCFCKVDCADQSFAAWDFYDDSLYVAAKDKCVVYNIFTDEKTTFDLPTNKRIIRLQMFEDKMVTVTVDSQIHYWDHKKKEVMEIPKKKPDENIYKMLLDNKKLIISSTAGIYIHDLSQGGRLIKECPIDRYSYDTYLFPKVACTLFEDKVLLTKLD